MRLRRLRNRQIDIDAVSRLVPEDRARVVGRGLLMAPVVLGWSVAASGCLILATIRIWNRRAEGLPAALRDGVPWPAVAVLAGVRIGLVPIYRHNQRVVEEMLHPETSTPPTSDGGDT
ncbi:MAG: hypothetical protein ACRDQA_13665 [Nocardioidaceae bacterium]